MPYDLKLEAGHYTHVFGITKGIMLDRPPTLLDKDAATDIVGLSMSNGELTPQNGFTKFPNTGNTTSNIISGAFLGSWSFIKNGVTYQLAFTALHVYQYNTTTTTWDCITRGSEIDDCEDAWTASANVTATADTTIKIRGSKSSKMVLASGFTTGIVAYNDTLTTTDISNAKHTHVTFFIYSTIALTADDMRLRLSEQIAGGTGATYADYTIPAISASKWTHVTVDITDNVAGSGTFPADFDALASVALVAQVDVGACTIYIDDIRATQCFTGDEDNRFSTGSLNDVFIFTNGVDPIGKITESAGVLTADLLTTTLASGSISTSEVILVLKDHVIFMNNTENGADTPRRASWSNIGQHEDYVNGTAGYRDLTDSQFPILAALLLTENSALIYTEGTITLMEWVGGQDPFRFTTKLYGVGTLGKDTVVNVNGIHVSVDKYKAYKYAGGPTPDRIDGNIPSALSGALDSQYANRSFIIVDASIPEAQIWIPSNDTIPDEGWCVNLEENTWYRHSRTISGFGYYQSQSAQTIGEWLETIGDLNFRLGDTITSALSPIILVGTQDERIYWLTNSTLNNNQLAVSREFRTPNFVVPELPEYRNVQMRVTKVSFEAKGQSVTLEYSTDNGSTWRACQGNGTNTVTLSSVYTLYQLDFDDVVDSIQFRFTNSTTSSAFSLRYYGFYWILAGRRR